MKLFGLSFGILLSCACGTSGLLRMTPRPLPIAIYRSTVPAGPYREIGEVSESFKSEMPLDHVFGVLRERAAAKGATAIVNLRIETTFNHVDPMFDVRLVGLSPSERRKRQPRLQAWTSCTGTLIVEEGS